MELNPKTTEIISLFNESKLMILKALYKCKEDVCGCDLVEKLKIPKNLLSYHIKTLRESGFIEEKKCGKMKNYQITKENLDKVEEILKVVELI